jgi:EmrB/QacA subfamily drug resistance transporter
VSQAVAATMTPNQKMYSRRWAILAILGLAQLMVVLDATIVNIALPSAQADLGFSDANRQWIITAYALAFGSLLLFGGRLSDLLGRKWVFFWGLIGFAVASALGGLAQDFTVLVTARALQGVFGALLAPAALSLLTTTFTDPKERGKAFGIYGAIAGAGGALGLLLGGVLTEYLSWRWCLWVNLILAIPAAIAAVVLLVHQGRGKAHLDIPGTITSVLGLLALVYGFTKAETDGWTSGITIGLLIAAVVLLVAFVWIEIGTKDPLLPMRVLTDRNRGGAYLGLALASAALFGVFLFLTFYLQATLGYSPIKTGLAFLPMIGAIMLTATTSTALILPRTGPRLPVTLGMLLGMVGLLLFTQIGVDSAYVSHVLPGLVVTGLGLGLVFAVCFEVGTMGVKESDAGVASAMVNTTQQVGGSIGTALLSTVFATAVTAFVASSANPEDPATQAAAALEGYATAFWWAAGIFLLSAVVCGLLMTRDTPEHDPDVPRVAA